AADGPDGGDEPAAARQDMVADLHQPGVGCRLHGGAAQARRKLMLVLVRFHGERGDQRGGRGTGNAHHAMDEQGRLPVPAAGEADDRGDMLFAGRDEVAGAGKGDVVDADDQVAFGGDDGRAVEGLLRRDEAQHVATAMAHGEFRDLAERRDDDRAHRHTAAASGPRSRSSASKRSAKRCWARVAVSGEISIMSSVMPRGAPKNLTASAWEKPASS